MKTVRSLSIVSVAFAAVLLIAVSCTGNLGVGLGGLEGEGWEEEGTGGTGPYELAPGCDPDQGAACPEDFFLCIDDEAGNKRCEGQGLATPDEGAWECYEEGTTLVCRGDHVPADSGIWTCQELGGAVVCRAHAYVPVGDDSWTCWYEGASRICATGEGGEGGEVDQGTGSEEPGSEEPVDQGEGGESEWEEWFPDSNGDGIPDGLEGVLGDLIEDLFGCLFGGCGGGTPDDGLPGDDYEVPEDAPPGCVCVPGAWRFCDTPTYCRWGVQYCADDGSGWGTCSETGIPAECSYTAWYSTDAEACCIASGYCCQDMWDADYDGDTWESLGSCTDISC